ncbi:TolC family protein [Calditrichota bacterium]
MLSLIICIAIGLSSFVYQTAYAETITVEQVLVKTLSSHPMVTAARARYDQAVGQRLIDLSPESPSMAIEYEGIPSGEAIASHEERRISLSQEIIFPLQYVWNMQATGITLDGKKNEAMIQILDIEQEVRETYVQAWLSDQQLLILQENTIAAEKYSKQLLRLAELGEISPLAERRARVEALQVSTYRDAAIQERVAIWAKLKGITGIDTAGLILSTPVDGIRPTSQSFDATTLENSFELQSALLEGSLADVELKMAKFNWLPNIEFSYFQQNVPMETNPDFWGIEAGISLPIWFWLGGRGEIQAARANRKAVRANLESIRLEMSNLLLELLQSETALREKLALYSEQILPLAEETYNLALRSYNLGESSSLEGIDAQRTFLDIRLETVEIIAELAIVTSEIDRLTGHSLIGFEELQKLLGKGH